MSEPDDLRLGAAELAFELLRFEQGAAHRFPGSVPPGQPMIGEDVFIFLPSMRQIASEAVPAYLAGLPAPAMIASTTTQGMATLLLLDELHGIRRSGLERGFANQTEALEQVSRQLQLSDSSTVLVEGGDHDRIFPLAIVKEWARRFLVNVGWNLHGLPSGARADASFVLMRSDGRPSRGGPRPVSEG